MKKWMLGLTISLGLAASTSQADQIVNVDGEDYLLSALLENCQSITDNPAAQIACISEISQLLEEQSGNVQQTGLSVSDTLAALRNLAQYGDAETGLIVEGTDCNIRLIYYGNYFHISRRNISTIDLYSAQFNVSQIQVDQIVEAAAPPLSKGMMINGANAVTSGGLGLESAQHNFAPRAPDLTLDGFAIEVANQLAPTEAQSFDFVLVHPARSEASADIWSAFGDLALACRGR